MNINKQLICLKLFIPSHLEKPTFVLQPLIGLRSELFKVALDWMFIKSITINPLPTSHDFCCLLSACTLCPLDALIANSSSKHLLP